MIRRWTRDPLFWILLAAAALRITGLFWGLPGADGWDNDGFAPRNFLTALALTWKPGSYFTYPPLQALILALPSLPVAGWALAHAPSLHPHDVIATITQPAYMTYFSVVARLISIAMSLGIIYCVGRMAKLVAGGHAGLFASAAAALCVGLTYYGQVSNLDVPFLFWASLSMLAVMRAVTQHKTRHFWRGALFAACAVATKDQAYAVFALSLPAPLALWFAVDRWPRQNARTVAITLVLAGLAALFAVLLVDGAITNPSGFLKRIAFLTGPASQDYVEYVRGTAGWWALLGDMARYFTRGTGLLAVVLAATGVLLHAKNPRDGRWTAGWLPLLAMVSFTVCFNFVALRSDDRFLLPQAVFACVYVGIAAERLAFGWPDWRAMVGRVVLAAVALLAVHQCMAVNAAMLFDPRYDAQAWLNENVKQGDTIEVYDRNWLLPHLPAGAIVVRRGQGDVKLRNPLPGVTEVQGQFSTPRAPRFIVVSGWMMRRFLRAETPPRPGRAWSPLEQSDFRNSDARAFFQALDEGRIPYRVAHVARVQASWWPALRIHDSLNEPIGIFEHAP